MPTAHGPARPHGHAHPHHHHHPAAARSQPVVLDLGAGVGALVVRTGPTLNGLEVELSPGGRDGERQHKQVLARTAGEETAHVLVYDGLAAGEYTVWLDETTPGGTATVAGGRVSELDWSDR